MSALALSDDYLVAITTAIKFWPWNSFIKLQSLRATDEDIVFRVRIVALFLKMDENLQLLLNPMKALPFSMPQCFVLISNKIVCL